MYYIYDNIFTDEHCKNEAHSILTYLKDNRFLSGIYCIIYSTNDKDLFDIINLNELRVSYYRNREIYILGLAKGRNSAISLVAELINKELETDNIDNIRSFYPKEAFVAI